MIVKTEEKRKALYQPAKLLLMGQKIYDFCQKFPAVVFNAPPDYQEEFKVQYAKQIADTEHDHTAYLKRSGEFFFRNKPVNDFLEKIEESTWLMLSVMGKKELITVVTKVGTYYSDNDFPKSCRIDFHHTNGFRKYFGRGHVWSGHVLAVTVVNNMRKEMAILDPDAEIFLAKARKYAVTPEEYYQRNFRIEVVPLNQSFQVIKGAKFVENELFRVTRVRGKEIICPVTSGKIFEGMSIDRHSLAILSQEGEIIYAE